MQHAARISDESFCTPSGMCDDFAVIQIFEVDGVAFGDFQGEAAGCEAPLIVIFADCDVGIGDIQVEGRTVRAVFFVVDKTSGDDVRAATSLQ